MQLTLELKHLKDLEILLPLLRRLEIAVIQPPQKTLDAKAKKPPLSKHIGVLPSLNASAFEQYLNQSRNEWERPIS